MASPATDTTSVTPSWTMSVTPKTVIGPGTENKDLSAVLICVASWTPFAACTEVGTGPPETTAGSCCSANCAAPGQATTRVATSARHSAANDGAFGAASDIANAETARALRIARAIGATAGAGLARRMRWPLWFETVPVMMSPGLEVVVFLVLDATQCAEPARSGPAASCWNQWALTFTADHAAATARACAEVAPYRSVAARSVPA